MCVCVCGVPLRCRGLETRSGTVCCGVLAEVQLLYLTLTNVAFGSLVSTSRSSERRGKYVSTCNCSGTTIGPTPSCSTSLGCFLCAPMRHVSGARCLSTSWLPCSQASLQINVQALTEARGPRAAGCCHRRERNCSNPRNQRLVQENAILRQGT